MKTWDDWSDFDINLAVAKKRGFVVSSNSNGHSAVDARGDDGYNAWFTLDYCNSWGDIGQIIQSKQIDLISPTAGGMSVWQAEKFYPEKLSGNINASAKNPLRAAAIVFLMMNGVNPE